MPRRLVLGGNVKEAIRRIPGPVLPLFTHGSQTHPTLQELQDAGAAAAWYPALTTMAGLQASWDFLNDFQERGTKAIDDFLASRSPEQVGRRHQWRHPGGRPHPGDGRTSTCRSPDRTGAHGSDCRGGCLTQTPSRQYSCRGA